MIRRTLPDQATGPGSAAGPVIYAYSPGKYHLPAHVTPYTLVSNHISPGNYKLNGRPVKINDGSYYLLNDGDSLEIDFRKSEPVQTLLVQFDTKYFNRLNDSLRISYQAGLEPLPHHLRTEGIPAVPFGIGPALQQKLSRLIRVTDEDSLNLLLGKIAEDVALSAAGASRELQKLRAVKQSTREEIYKRLSAAKSFIDEAYNQPLTTDWIAGVACMNSFHFLRLFRELYGSTPHQYLTRRRLEAARGYLRSGRYPVADVCVLTGFSSVGSFSLLFKRTYGYAPGFLKNAAFDK